MKILILCTGNSCRSQMAHGFLQSFDKNIQVYSAGTHPAEKVNPLVVKIMSEVGIDISKHIPTNVTAYLSDTWDYGEILYELITRMKSQGVDIYLKDEVEERFAVIDDELVWHGGVNLLGKEDVWDNLMRIKNIDVAAELLEIGFGRSDRIYSRM